MAFPFAGPCHLMAKSQTLVKSKSLAAAAPGQTWPGGCGPPPHREPPGPQPPAHGVAWRRRRRRRRRQVLAINQGVPLGQSLEMPSRWERHSIN